MVLSSGTMVLPACLCSQEDSHCDSLAVSNPCLGAQIQRQGWVAEVITVRTPGSRCQLPRSSCLPLEEGAVLYLFTEEMIEVSSKLSSDLSQVTQLARATGREVSLAPKPKVFTTHNLGGAHACWLQA